MAQRKEPLPFGRAKNKLLEQLGKAEEIYSGFQRDFDSDIGSIKKYATVEVLNELWVLRVLGNKDPKAIQGDDAGNDDSLRDSKEFICRYEARCCSGIGDCVGFDCEGRIEAFAQEINSHGIGKAPAEKDR